jgi:hypothetical protein
MKPNFIKLVGLCIMVIVLLFIVVSLNSCARESYIVTEVAEVNGQFRVSYINQSRSLGSVYEYVSSDTYVTREGVENFLALPNVKSGGVKW